MLFSRYYSELVNKNKTWYKVYQTNLMDDELTITYV